MARFASLAERQSDRRAAARPRLWILGRPDPEMEAIRELLYQLGESVVTQDAAPCYVPHRPGDTWYWIECRGLTPEDATSVILDHHSPGDPGFGRAPAEYLTASSLGQVVTSAMVAGLLPADWVIPQRLRLIAAADHCLAAAYAGQCPLVSPSDLMAFRAEERARFQGRTVEAVLADILSAQRELAVAPAIDLGGDVLVRDMRRERGFPELPEAATRLGVGYIAGPLKQVSGRVKYVCSGTPSQVRAFISWAARQGLTDVYGDPERGFAGGYGGG